MDPDVCLQSFLESVRLYRETGDEDEAVQAMDFHARLHYWLNSGAFEPDWAAQGTTKEEFYSYTATGRFTIKVD